MEPYRMIDFVIESNSIEGITVTGEQELIAHKAFLEEKLGVDSIERFVSAVQSNGKLRQYPNMDVVVARSYHPPRGGPHIYFALAELLDKFAFLDPWELYCKYEALHPFTDGNGRSGRALWLKHMGGIEKVPMGFLRTFHIQSLQEYRQRWTT